MSGVDVTGGWSGRPGERTPARKGSHFRWAPAERCCFLIRSSAGVRPNVTIRSHALSDLPRSVRRGQSFAGLLTVLLVLTLLTAFAAPRVDLTRYRSDAMARQAAAVFTAASRSARRARHDVVVRVDSAGKRLSVVADRNGNGKRDPGESETWTDLDPSADILDPPSRLPVLAFSDAQRPVHMSGLAAPVSPGWVVFRRTGGANADFVLYLTSDPGLPSAWRAVQVASRTGSVLLWRFDGTRWSRGRT